MLKPNQKKRPTATEILEFDFFNQVKSKNKRTPSQTQLQNPQKITIKELNQMRIEIANLQKINEILRKDNSELNYVIKKEKNNESKKIAYELGKEKEKLIEENKNLKKQMSQVKSDLSKTERQANVYRGKLEIKNEAFETLEKDYKKSKDLASYLFTNTKVFPFKIFYNFNFRYFIILYQSKPGKLMTQKFNSSHYIKKIT